MKLTHFDDQGNAIMVDVTQKQETLREAWAAGCIRMSRECLGLVKQGQIEKGDVLATARIAGIMGAKRTAELIPLCHLLCTTGLKLNFALGEDCVYALCYAKAAGKTGVEMEALTGVNVALLTIYDMCKAVDKSMQITDVSLCRKTGGKSGSFRNNSAIASLPEELRKQIPV